jgi:hypothetical protein
MTSPTFRGSSESFLFFGTRSVPVDQAFPLFTEDGLKGATAPCTVHRLVFRPPGVPAVEIAEFHTQTIASFLFLLLLSDRVHRFSLVILNALRYEGACSGNPLLAL